MTESSLRLDVIGVLFLAQCLALSYANTLESGCPENLPRYCRCNDLLLENNTQTNNLEILCNSRNLGDLDLYSVMNRIEESYTAPDEDDRQEKTAADDSDSVLTLGNSKPRFYNFNLTNTGIGTFDFKLMENVHFKTINIVNNRKLRQILRAQRLDNSKPGKFSLDKLTPTEVINGVTQKIVIEGSPSLGQGRSERDLFDQLSRFKALKSITLSNNGLKRVPDDAFGSRAVSRKIRSINLKENRIREIGQRAFSGLPLLNHLTLDGNNLVRLYDSSFAIDNSTSDIMMIFLRYNRLDENSFDENTFGGLEKRNLFIYLTGNRLTTLPEAVFKPLLKRTPHRVFVTLFDNPLNCEDCSLAWLFRAGKERFRQRVFGAVCQQTQQEIWKLEADYFDSCPN